MVPMVVLGPTDVKMMFIIADKLSVFILEFKKKGLLGYWTETVQGFSVV